MPPPYYIPADRHRVTDSIKKSRFITTLAPAASPEAAKKVISKIKAEFSDASHNCWAYVAGPPGDTARCGLSDDGEPHGTAGKPILNVLLHCHVGEILAVVTRYFGGIKLGTGGLVRAYAGGVQHALESLVRIEKRTWVPGAVAIDYKQLEPVKHLLAAAGARVVNEVYGGHVDLEYEAPEENLPELAARLARLVRS